MDRDDLRVAMTLLITLSLCICASYGPYQDARRANYEINQIAIFEKLPAEKAVVKPRQNAWGGSVEVRGAGPRSGLDLIYAGVPAMGCLKLGLNALQNGPLALAVNGIDIPVGEKNEKLDANVERLLAACKKSESNNTLTFSKPK